MNKQFILKNFIDNEAEDSLNDSKNEEEKEENIIDTSIPIEDKKRNQKKIQKINRQKFTQEEIEKEEKIIQDILKKNYRSRTQYSQKQSALILENKKSVFIKKKNDEILQLSQKALILSQQIKNNKISPVNHNIHEKKIRVGFKCNSQIAAGKKEEDESHIRTDKGEIEDIEELKVNHEKKLIKKISEISSGYKKTLKQRIEEDDKILKNVIKINNKNESNPIKKENLTSNKNQENKYIPYTQKLFTGKNNSFLNIIKENKNIFQEEKPINNKNVNNPFMSKNDTKNELSLTAKIKFEKIFK